MRILHVITRLILGGAQQNTVISCDAHVRAGHEVWLAYGPIYGPEGSLLHEALRSGAELVRIRSLRRPLLPIHDVRCYFALRWLIRKVQPDVVHPHSSKAGILARAAAWDEKVPAVIHTIHGLPFHVRQGAATYGAYVAAERWAARRCHRLLGLTRTMCETFHQHRIGRSQQFEVVPSGVDIEGFEQTATAPREMTRRAYGIPADASVVGIVARLDRLKGHDDLIDILPELVQRHPQVHVLFVGDGYHRQQLEHRVSGTPLEGRVVFTGLVPPTKVHSLYRAMDIMALPSYQEGQGRTIVEALLCGCVVTGYDTGGIGEVCIDGRTGRLIKVGDKAALCRALASLLEHPEERSRLVEQGRRHVRAHFSQSFMVRRLEEIYQEVLSEENGCRVRVVGEIRNVII